MDSDFTRKQVLKMPTETLFCSIVKSVCTKAMADKLCPDEIPADGMCWNCRTNIPFVIPRRGYSNGSGRCSACGEKYTMMSSYGLITLFPIGVLDDYAVEFLDSIVV